MTKKLLITPNDVMLSATAYLRRHEGVVKHFYLDVNGYVTIGVGFMIPTTWAARKLHLVKRDAPKTAATAEEITADWKAVNLLPKGKKASWYRAATELDMPSYEITEELVARIQGFDLLLKHRWPDLETYPATARLGLLDMAYSLGLAGLINKFPRFCRAVSRKKWFDCANECKREGVSVIRNDECWQLFIKAGNEK